MIVVVDCGISNVRSVVNMVRKAGGTAEASSDRGRIQSAHKLILPGVGAFTQGMANLHELGLVDVLADAALTRKVPILGLCLGMQLLTRDSEEGGAAGLGWLPARTRRFEFERSSPLKVPHMGWNEVAPAKADPLLESLPPEPRFYFVHSYYVECDDPGDVLLWSTHGERFAAAIRRGNLWGMQFHPEKSHKYGLALMRSFVGVQ
jgi:imidazole glycerol-phosphate synthase subunit HisH